MRLASTSRGLASTILVIVVLAAALAILCADGVHVPLAGAVNDVCVAMTHSTALGVASDSGLALLVASMFVVAIAGFAMMSNATSLRPVTDGLAQPSGRSADPLNGRLRL